MYQETSMDGRELRETRRELGLTQQHVARACYQSQAQVSNMELGKISVDRRVEAYLMKRRESKQLNGNIPSLNTPDVLVKSIPIAKNSRMVHLTSDVAEEDKIETIFALFPIRWQLDNDRLKEIVACVARQFGQKAFEAGFRMGAKRMENKWRDKLRLLYEELDRETPDRC
jgi:transcriptional regulator with XRE-family HTH domain